jgi:hypothetical protein
MSSDTISWTAVIVAVLAVWAIILLSTLPLYFLWNWLIPALFNGPTMTFWQAIGMNFLITVIFGNARFPFTNKDR